MHKLLKSYIVNTIIAIAFFAPIVVYNEMTGGHKWNADDTAAIVMLGWIFGAMIKNLFKAFLVTSKDAKDEIEKIAKK
jgi:hypothetical protein